jgi:hypothetical protein
MAERTAGRVEVDCAVPPAGGASVVEPIEGPGQPSHRLGRLAVVVAVVVAVLTGAAVVARSGDGDDRQTAATTASAAPGRGPSQELGAQLMIECARPPTGVPVDADFAFAGTVTAVDPAPTPSEEQDVTVGRWTLAVDEWFSGPGPAEVTVPLSLGAETILGPDGERTDLGVGDRLLLSGFESEGDEPWGDLPYEPGLCGYSRTFDEPTADIWREAFRAGGVQDPDPPYTVDLPDGTGLRVDLVRPVGAPDPVIRTRTDIDIPASQVSTDLTIDPASSPRPRLRRGIDRWTLPAGSEARLVELAGGAYEVRWDHHGFRLAAVVPADTTPAQARALIAGLTVVDGPQGWPVVSPRRPMDTVVSFDLGDEQPLLTLLRAPCVGAGVTPDIGVEAAPAFSRCFAGLGIVAQVQARVMGDGAESRQVLESLSLQPVG